MHALSAAWVQPLALLHAAVENAPTLATGLFTPTPATAIEVHDILKIDKTTFVFDANVAAEAVEQTIKSLGVSDAFADAVGHMIQAGAGGGHRWIHIPYQHPLRQTIHRVLHRHPERQSLRELRGNDAPMHVQGHRNNAAGKNRRTPLLQRTRTMLLFRHN